MADTTRQINLKLNLQAAGANVFKGIAADVVRVASLDERRLLAMKGVNAALDDQRQGLDRIEAALHPDKVRELVVLQQERELAQHRLNAAIEEEERLQGAVVQSAVSADQRRLAGIKTVNEGLDSQRQKLAGIEAALDPRKLQQKVGLDLKVETAQKKLAEVEGQERQRQKYGTGARGFLNRAVAGASGEQVGGAAGVAGAALQGGMKGGSSGALSAGLAAAGPYGAAAGVVLESTGLGSVLESVSSVPAILKTFTSIVIDFASKASPAEMRRFSMAIDDVQGVIGQRLRPVLETFTEGIRLGGDFLASVLPSAEEVKAALEPISAALKELRPALAELAPVLRDLSRTGIKALGMSIKVVTDEIMGPIRVLRALGLISPDKGLSTSYGAAGRQASFSSVDEYAKKIYQNAFSAGITQPENPAEETNKLLKDLLGKILEGVKVLVGAKGVAAAAANGAAGGVGGAGFGIPGFGW